MTETLIRADEEIREWFGSRIPDGWFTGTPEVKADREEILVVGAIPEPEYEKGASKEAKEAAKVNAIRRFREETREQRIGIALQAEHLYRRKVSWGAECGGVRRHFTTLSVPAMTRLRMPGRAVLDTLVDAGVARSRSEALAWCVRLVAENQEKWLKDLKKAFEEVEKVRSSGPTFEA
jgi:hypothetical protein